LFDFAVTFIIFIECSVLVIARKNIERTLISFYS
jgi:hypothetical protein